jgi:hypothetical protein
MKLHTATCSDTAVTCLDRELCTASYTNKYVFNDIVLLLKYAAVSTEESVNGAL